MMNDVCLLLFSQSAKDGVRHGRERVARRLLGTALLLLMVALAGCEKQKSFSPSPVGRETSGASTVGSVAPSHPSEPKSDVPRTASKKTRATALLAGGCFWGMEEIIRDIPGVVDTEVGYTGGSVNSANYDQVKTGETGHAESLRIIFDPSELSYAALLENWFFKMHDPTTLDRQGNDVGSQYRSAIFYTTDEQKQIAEKIKRKVEASGAWSAPLVTSIEAASSFTPAEDYHQDYLEKNPGGYTCHFLRDKIY